MYFFHVEPEAGGGCCVRVLLQDPSEGWGEKGKGALGSVKPATSWVWGRGWINSASHTRFWDIPAGRCSKPRPTGALIPDFIPRLWGISALFLHTIGFNHVISPGAWKKSPSLPICSGCREGSGCSGRAQDAPGGLRDAPGAPGVQSCRPGSAPCSPATSNFCFPSLLHLPAPGEPGISDKTRPWVQNSHSSRSFPLNKARQVFLVQVRKAEL